jgi:hypothetical protein
MVYLLGRMGNNAKALALIIDRLGDVHRVSMSYIHCMFVRKKTLTRLCHKAIEFAKEQNDEDLWDDLLKYSMDKPGRSNDK